MEFSIPDNLDRLTQQGLREVTAEAVAAHTALAASVTAETVTDEQLTQLQALTDFIAGANTRIARADSLAALSATQTVVPEVEAPIVGDVVIPATTPVHEHSAPVGTALSAIRISDLEPDQLTHQSEVQRANYGSLVAAADVPGFPAGSAIDMTGFARAFEARAAGFRGLGKVDHEVHVGVATIERDYPAELSVYGDQRDADVLKHVADETRLPGGSLLKSVEQRYEELGGNTNPNALTAASGWCAPSETIYTICSQITTDGLADFPEVQARRGGIRHNTGLDFGTIFGNGTGYFNLTEAQVAAGTEKTCKEIPCPDFVDDRLGVTGLCLTANFLAVRGYPEFTSTFTQGALAAHAHQLNMLQIAAVVTDSTAVTLSGAPWATDGTVLSQVLSAVEMSIVDIKYRLRLQRSATLEVILPFWLLAQFRADMIRRNGGDYAFTPGLADSQINAWFAMRGARVQWVYDWQDAFADSVTAGEPGSTTPIGALPTTLDFIVYPAGTWVRAVSDVITLNAVYDSTQLITNQFTHLFMETGWKMIRLCPVSRVYTIAICPSGETSALQTVTC